MAAGDVSRIVLGLGNPGERYRDTRHNVGFRVVAEFGRRRGAALAQSECGALVGAFAGGEPDGRVLLALPQTYMNRSGFAARCLVERYGVPPEALLVVYDEVHLPLGRLRLRRSGSPGGHRGMESILEGLATDQVPRLRIGVAPEGGSPAGEEIVDFVLSPFAPAELPAVQEMVERAADACGTWLTQGVDAAMQAFNR